MKQVVPRSALDVDETGYWRRMPVVVGILFGASMGAASLVLPVRSDLVETYGRAGVAVGVMLFAGTFFGLAFPLLFRRTIRRLQDKVYRGDPPFLAPPPADLTVEYSLPATLWDSSPRVGGVLYLGREDVLFVPHVKEPPAAAVMRLGSPQNVRLHPRPAPLGAWARLFVTRPPTIVDVGDESSRRSFLLPAPATTIPVLRAIIEGLETRIQS